MVRPALPGFRHVPCCFTGSKPTGLMRLNSRHTQREGEQIPTLKLPIVVCGERRDSSAAGMMRVEYESGLTVEIPRPDPDDVESILKSSNEELRAMPLDDILIFLDEVGKRWSNPQYP